MTLDEIAIKHGCDKSSLKHDYCRIYEQYFMRFHLSYPVFLLEIGYGGYEDPDKGGESARMWMEYFGMATITDIHPKNNIPFSCHYLQTDVTKRPNYINDSPDIDHHFDIIIDDGSHLNADIIAAFKNLWPVLNPGGLYCVEDTHSSYDPYYEDSNPDFMANMPETAMDFFTFLCHSVNHDFIKQEYLDRYPSIIYPDIEFIHFYKDLIIIKKKAV